MPYPFLPTNGPANPFIGSAYSVHGIRPKVSTITFSVGTAAASADEYVTKSTLGVMPNATIENGVLTFTVPQIHPYIGIGDRVELNDGGSVYVYLNEKINTRQWRVHDVAGDAAIDRPSVPVVSIDKAFNDIRSAIHGDNSGAFSNIGTHDLISKLAMLRIACYEMSDFMGTERLELSDLWVQDHDYRVKIFTPNNISTECNKSQRHKNGRYDQGGYVINTNNSWIIQLFEYVIIEGLIVGGGGIATSNGILCLNGSYDYFQIRDNVFFYIDKAIGLNSAPDHYAIVSNVISNCINGIALGDASTSDGVCYNNTIDDCSGDGISYSAGTNVLITNNIVQNSGTCINDNGAGKTNLINCITDDNSCAGGVSCHPNTTVRFENAAARDYRLHISDTVAYVGFAGADLSTDNRYSFIRDINGDLIDDSWCIGAFHKTPEVTFSVGPNSDIKSGSPTYSITNSIMTFSAAQTDELLSAGCVVEDAGTNHLLKRKISDTEWEVTELDGTIPADVAGPVTIISIKHHTTNLYDVITDSSEATHILNRLGSIDLAATDINVRIACVAGITTRKSEVDGYTCDRHRHVDIFSPDLSDSDYIESNQNRRHNGKWGELSYLSSTTDFPVNEPHSVYSDRDGYGISFKAGADFCTVKGLQISSSIDGVLIDGSRNNTVDSNIVKDCKGNGVTVTGSEKSNENLISNNTIINCGGSGIEIQHGSAFEPFFDAKFGTPGDNGFIITSMVGHAHIFKKYTVTVELSSVNKIEWSPGRLRITVVTGSSVESAILFGEVLGTPWATLTGDGTNPAIALSETRMEDAVTLLEYAEEGSGLNHYIYNNTIAKCQRGIFIEVLTEDWNTNVAVLRNNAVSGCELDNYYSTHVFPITILAENNWSDDQSILNFYGSNNVDNISPRFVNSPAEDYRVTLYDLERMDGINLATDENFQVEYDNVGTEYASYLRWTVGANTWKFRKKSIHCSVGTESGNLDEFPTDRKITIENGVAEFSVNDISSSIGVGDRVQYDDGGPAYCYLAEKGTTHRWCVVDASGNQVSSLTEKDVTDITRVSNSLEPAFTSDITTEFPDISDKDIAADELDLYVWCYDDDVDDVTEVVIDTWPTSPFYRIYVQAPWDTMTQCISQQMHTGIYDGYRITSDDEPNGSSGTVIGIISTDHVVVRGLAIEPPPLAGMGIGTNSGRDGIIVENNVVNGGGFGINVQGTPGCGNRVYGNILYGQSDYNVSVDGGSALNNTAVGPSTNGIIVSNAGDENINNICQDQVTCFSGSATPIACISSDGTAGTDDECMSNVTLNFVDKAGKDFHLNRNDWHAINRGKKLSGLYQFKYVSSSYTDYSFYRDVDNEALGDDEWSIGADSFVNLETIDLYFSAVYNDLLNYRKGTSPYLEISDGVMTFSEPQDNPATGIGDKIDYDIDNKECFLYRKISDTIWEVRDKFGIVPPNTTGLTDLNAINRALTRSFWFLFDQTDSESIQQFLGDSNNPFLHLRTARYNVNIAMYRHANYQEATIIRYFDTDANNRIRIFTPRDERNECNTSQAHNGNFDTTTLLPFIRSLGTRHAVSLYVDHTEIDGVSISGDADDDKDSIALYKANHCKILNNFFWLGDNGVKPNSMGHDDFTGEHFSGSISDMWDSNFYLNWELRSVPGIGDVAVPKWANVGSVGNLTFGPDESGDFDYEFGMVLGSDDSAGEALRFILDDGAIKAECKWESGVLDFGSAQINLPWEFNREYKIRLVRGGTITSDGLYVDDAGEDSTTSLYYLDNFNDGDGTGSGKWVKHPGTYTSWSGDHHIEVEGPKTHGFSYIDLWIASYTPSSSKIVGKNSNNIIINNTGCDLQESGIVTTNTDILYNNTIDECVEYCYHNSDSDLLINNIGQRGTIADYYNGDTAEFCVSSDSSLVVNEDNKNIDSTTLTFINKAGASEFRDYHLALATDDSAIWSGKHLVGNVDHPFNIDGGGISRRRKWDRGSLEYQSKRVVYAVGDKNTDHKSKPTVGGLTYIIEEVNGRSYINFYTPQIKSSMGIGSQIIDTGTPFSDGCLLIEKITQSKWVVADFKGNNIPDRFGTVFSITRVFNTLYEATGGSGITGSSYLDNTSLSNVGVYVELACYDEGIGRAIQTALNVDSIGCDKHHNLRIQSPRDVVSECNISQRHDGLYDEGFRFEPEFFDGSPASMRFYQTAYLEIEGMLLNANEGVKNGIQLFDCKDVHVGYNVVKDCGGSGIIIETGINPQDVVFNNLVYDCGEDGIVVKANFNPFFFVLTRINNNTVVNCRRGIYLEKANEEYSDGLSIELRNNIVQDSRYRDYVSTYENYFGRFALYNCISSDFSSWLFPGTGNIKEQYVRFIGRPDNYNLHKIHDGFAVDNGIDMSTDWLFSFFDDIGGRERDPGEYDIGAFEVVDIFGSGLLITGPVEITGKGFQGTDYPLLILHLRETVGDYLPYVDEKYQFTGIEGVDPDFDINAFLAPLPTTDNVIIYVQGGKTFGGTFELQDRNPRTVIIKTFPPEAHLGPASHVYTGPIVDDVSDQLLLTYDGMRVYSDNSAVQDYLLDNTAATKAIKFINSIVQVNKDSVIDNIPDAKVMVTNSILIYRNG